MPDPVITIDNLRHAYDGQVALNGLSLEVREGEIFGFLGPNGSGKTTLFRVLSTITPPQEGSVAVLLERRYLLPQDRDRLRPRLGVVFQYPSLDKQLTAEENLRHHGHLYGLRGADLERRIAEWMARLKIGDRRSAYISSLSGGLRRRVEIAKALLSGPSILLMDEPSTGLDPAARIDLWTALRDIRERDRVTILLTTHLLEEADHCDRLAIMDRGRIVALGTPAELKDGIGGDVISLTSRDPRALAEQLRRRLDVAIEEMDDMLRIERPRAHEFVPQLFEAAPGLIDSVSVGRPTLEDVFIHATGRRFRGEEPPAPGLK